VNFISSEVIEVIKRFLHRTNLVRKCASFYDYGIILSASLTE